MQKSADVGARVMVLWDLRPVRRNNPRKRERHWFTGVVKRQRRAGKPGGTTHLVYYPIDKTEAWHDAERMRRKGHWKFVAA
jgi:chlorite dismutase